MTQNEYIFSGLMSKPCEFTFKDGSKFYGAISSFKPGEEDSYYLLKNEHLVKFVELRDKPIPDLENMRNLLMLIDFSDITHAVEMD